MITRKNAGASGGANDKHIPACFCKALMCVHLKRECIGMFADQGGAESGGAAARRAFLVVNGTGAASHGHRVSEDRQPGAHGKHAERL